MKYLLIILGLSFYLNSSAQKDSLSVSGLSEDDRRKFDFFLYEGCRSKALNQPDEAKNCFYQCYLINPNSPVVLFELAQLLSNNPAQSIKLMESAVSFDQNNIFYLDFLARLYYQVGLREKCIATFERIYQINPKDQDFLYFLVKNCYQLRDYSSALRYLDILESEAGPSYTFLSDRLDILEAQNSISKMEDVLKSYLKRFPNDKSAQLLMANFYLVKTKKYKRAFNILSPLSNDSEVGGLATLYLVDYYILLDNRSEALKSLFKALSNPNLEPPTKLQYLSKFRVQNTYTFDFDGDKTFEFLNSIYSACTDDSSPLLMLGYYYSVDKGDKARGLGYFQKVLELDPLKYDAWIQVLLNFINEKDYKAIISSTSIALKYFPNDPTLLYYQGLSFSLIDDFLNASLSLQKANDIIKLDSDANLNLSIGILASLADVYFKIDSTNLCFSTYEELLKLDPKNLMALNNYAYYISVKGGDLVKAEKMSQLTIQLEPGNSTYLDTYAWVLFKQKRYSEARFIIERAIDNGGDTSEVIVEHYGDILYFNGSAQDAIMFWQKSSDLGNSSPSLQKKLSTGIYIE